MSPAKQASKPEGCTLAWHEAGSSYQPHVRHLMHVPFQPAPCLNVICRGYSNNKRPSQCNTLEGCVTLNELVNTKESQHVEIVMLWQHKCLILRSMVKSSCR